MIRLGVAQPRLFHGLSGQVQFHRPLRSPTHRGLCKLLLQSGRGHLRPQSVRCLYTSEPRGEDLVPLRKHLKAEAKRRKAAFTRTTGENDTLSGDRLKRWELTVGVEIHAELNTAKKLFSPAATSVNDEPNSHVALFDAAVPGAQPQFQKETLIPALRAAIVLNCEIQRRSTFDRKHYFYQDQPAGYQITQYYEPFAKAGHVVLNVHDGIAPEDAPSITIPIKQIQMEQDTAKSLHQPPSTYLLDFNRVSHPLIEIISMPAIHTPATAAAYVRKIQSILKSVDACTAGMELGGLRADVNVSVRQRQMGSGQTTNAAQHTYAGFSGLGQRTEIKNLSSFKAVEDAIIAERDRQISILESGGVIEGETRGFAIGSSQTRKLRSKEGEIDYRYMPDPDISPVFVSDDLVDHLRNELPYLPDSATQQLVDHGVTLKEARTLVMLNDGERLEYYYEVLHGLQAQDVSSSSSNKVGRTVANWVIQELGALLTASSKDFEPHLVPARQLTAVLSYLLQNRITTDTARSLVSRLLDAGESFAPVADVIQQEGLLLRPLDEETYEKLAKRFLDSNPQMVTSIKEKGQVGKVMWFVGQVMRHTDEGNQGRLEAKRVELAVKKFLGI